MDFLWMFWLLKTATIAFLLYEAVDYAYFGRPLMKTASLAYLLYLTVDYLVYNGHHLKTAASACLLFLFVDEMVHRFQEMRLARQGMAPRSLNISRLTQARRWPCDAIRLVDEAYKKVCCCPPPVLSLPATVLLFWSDADAIFDAVSRQNLSSLLP